MLGSRWGQEKRMQGAMLNHFCRPPPLTILTKDHKPVRQDGSRPGRPLCLARKAPNMILGNLMSTLLERVADSYNDANECINTETMCRGLDDANKAIFAAGEDPNKFTVGSIDAIALYPSLKVESTVKIIKQMVIESEVDFTDVCWQSLAKYLYIIYPPSVLQEEGVDKHIPLRYTNRGRKPTLQFRFN